MKYPVDYSVILPTYNESKNILRTIRKVIQILNTLSSRFEIIIVDDNSPDGTGKKVIKQFQKDNRIHTIIRTLNPGLSASILEGVHCAKGRIIIGMDADGNHDPNIIPQMIDALKKADVVVASRFIPGGGMENWLRYIASLCVNVILRVFYNFPIWDNTSGFYALRRDALFRLEPTDIYVGYGEYHLRLVYKAFQAGMHIVEVPVFYQNRIHGQSKSRLTTMVATYLRTADALSRQFK